MSKLLKSLEYLGYVIAASGFAMMCIASISLIDPVSRKPLEENSPKPNELEIQAKDFNRNDSNETTIYDRSKNKHYIAKYDSTGNLNFVPYSEGGK